MNGKVKSLLGAAAGVLLLAGTAIPALAADPTPPAATATSNTAWRGQGFGGRWGGSFSVIDPVAKLLGMQPADLAAERHAGKSLVDIAKAKGVDEAKLIDAILADRKAQIDARVRASTLTQEQADLMLQRMQTQVKTAVERTTVGPMGPAGGQGLGLGRGPRWQNGDQGQGFGPRMGGFGPRR